MDTSTYVCGGVLRDARMIVYIVTIGCEPKRLFNLIEFMINDKDGGGTINEDEIMEVLYHRCVSIIEMLYVSCLSVCLGCLGCVGLGDKDKRMEVLYQR